MTAITLSYQKIKSIAVPHVPWKAVLVTGIALVITLLVLYVILINAMTQGAYVMKTYDKQIDTLSSENQALHMKSAQTDELSRVIDQARSAGFEKASGIKYVQIFDNSLARAGTK